MFDSAFGLPLHVLVIHAVVVFVPLTVLGALGYAVVPRWRWLLRWPVLLGAAASLGSAFVAKQSGYSFFQQLGAPSLAKAHEDQGQLLVWVLLGFFVVVAAATFTLSGPTRLVNGRQYPGAARPVQLVVAVVLVAAALVAGVQVVRTGDSGARAVWGAAPSIGPAVPTHPGGDVASVRSA
ncbi:DUF2231 domain-containing protein [Actinopolymorpha alba]|uniref:DUF2231 domain-containing protein n=1 Tax=Actinopolymorpha alba TaxID=533267 RepID=UPI0003650D1F|nr:DUF2231 domain-containing protein [Actinopolymorpha alba]